MKVAIQHVQGVVSGRGIRHGTFTVCQCRYVSEASSYTHIYSQISFLINIHRVDLQPHVMFRNMESNCCAVSRFSDNIGGH
jgi:hypothetical protein